MLWRTPTAVLILLRPGVHFKPVKRNALPTDGDFRQAASHFAAESVFIHPQISRGIAQAYKSRQNRKHLSAPQIDSSDLLSDMAQLPADGQARL
jgi:hypothetical protein